MLICAQLKLWINLNINKIRSKLKASQPNFTCIKRLESIRWPHCPHKILIKILKNAGNLGKNNSLLSIFFLKQFMSFIHQNQILPNKFVLHNKAPLCTNSIKKSKYSTKNFSTICYWNVDGKNHYIYSLMISRRLIIFFSDKIDNHNKFWAVIIR